VFVDERPAVINRVVAYCGLDLVQLHGRESPDCCRKIACPVIKAIRVKNAGSLNEMELYRDRVEMFLLDTYIEDTAGGTGQAFDWSLARQASGSGKILLAGGLTPANVQEAVTAARPYGVDASSGVETGGRKDPAKIAEFIKQVRGREDVRVTG
jgi:phosphoribosylanthranilate isomerase